MASTRSKTGSVPQNGDEFTFSTKLLTKFDLVRAQAENGMFLFEVMTTFFGQYSSIMAKFSKELTVLSETMTNKLASANEPDRMNTTYSTALAILAACGQMGADFSSHSTKVMSNVATPFKRVHEKGLQTLGTIIAAERKLTGEMKRLEEACKVARRKSTKLLDQLPPTQTVYNSLKVKMKDAPRQTDYDNQQSFVRNRMTAINSAKRWVFKNTEKNREKTRLACLEYQHVLSEANFYQKKYLSFGLPNALTQLESLERTRMNALKKNLIAFVQLEKEKVQQQQKVVQTMYHKTSEINPNRDITQFISRVLEVHGQDSQVVTMFKYNLSLTPDDLKASSFREDGTVIEQGLFNRPLAAVMKLQKTSRPLPRIVTTLTHAIKVFGGFETEGIFRLSASQTEKNQLRRQLERGDYTISDQMSPHVPAALLKEWLRGLPEPLIPTALYDRCIQLGAKDSENTDFVKKRRDLMCLLAELPRLNLRIIDHLGKVVNKIAEKKDVNRMGLPNLAIVFAPSFLKSPSGSVLVQMENTQYEARFLIYLFQALAAPAEKKPSSETDRFNSVSMSLNTYVPKKPEASMSISSSPASPMSPTGGKNTSPSIGMGAARPSQSASHANGRTKTGVGGQQQDDTHHRRVRATQMRTRQEQFEANRKQGQLQAEDVAQLGLDPNKGLEDDIKNEPDPEDDFEEEIIEEKIKPLPQNWERYEDDDGTPYYCNLLTQETQWELPTQAAKGH